MIRIIILSIVLIPLIIIRLIRGKKCTVRYGIELMTNSQVEIDGKWYIAKPMLKPLAMRITDAFEVIIGRQTAIEFKEDQIIKK